MHLNKISSLLLFGSLHAFTSSFSLMALAAEDYVIPRTEWGQPDIQGVWNFSSNVPMQRPSKFGERQFLTAEEVAEAAAQRAARDAASDSALPIPGVDESYNDFWIENAGIGGNLRTSHIIYPTDGRIPARVEGAQIQTGFRLDNGSGTRGTRPVRFIGGGIGAGVYEPYRASADRDGGYGCGGA